MAKARFYIQNHVQEARYRLFIIQRILDSDLEGTARNLPDGRVEVLLKGEKEHIIDFVKQLKEEKPELAKNPTLSEIGYNDSLIIPDVMRTSQGLVVEQLGKGVPLLVGINDKLDKVDKKLDKLDKLDKLEGIERKLDELPKRIAEELNIDRRLDELPKRIAEELNIDRRLDELPKRIAEEMKKVLT